MNEPQKLPQNFPSKCCNAYIHDDSLCSGCLISIYENKGVRLKILEGFNLKKIREKLANNTESAIVNEKGAYEAMWNSAFKEWDRVVGEKFSEQETRAASESELQPERRNRPKALTTNKRERD